MQSRGGRKAAARRIAFTQAALANTRAELAPLLAATADNLLTRLGDAGFTTAAADVALTEIAGTSGKGEVERVAALLPAAR